MYRKQISQKASPSLRATPINQAIAQNQSYGSLSSVVQRAQQDPDSVSGDERQQLESAIGTRSTREVLAGKQTPWVPEFQGISAQLWGDSGQVVAPIQAKLTIGEVGDKYEREADRVAADVVQRINQPQAVSPKQQETVQRQDMSEDKELQMKSLMQCREAIGGGQASTDLESSINSARGGGQPLDTDLQRSMGQVMGADFSGVKVHTNAQADQLNQSIQAKAFTTGQDVFFRQGTYEPGSRGGQELIAHELTHVVQQLRNKGDRDQVQRARENKKKDDRGDALNIVITGGSKMHFSQHPMDNPTQEGTQKMIPSAKDLEELKNMMNTESQEFRKGWDKLTPSQAWALLAAEKKGEIQVPKDKERVLKRLRELNEEFKTSYPTTGEDANSVIAQIGKYISSRLIASNFNLNAPPGANRMSDEEIDKAPKSLAQLLMEDKDGEFRQVWESGTSQASADLFSRGAVEEQFGYAAAVGRRGGQYQNPQDRSASFAPDNKSEMPKYAALVSHNQLMGVAPRYGASIIYWKETLRSRVTHTPGDSWGNMGGRLYTSNKHPLPLMAEGDPQLVRLMAAEATNFKYDAEMEKSKVLKSMLILRHRYMGN
jgi:hypothetical protein